GARRSVAGPGRRLLRARGRHLRWRDPHRATAGRAHAGRPHARRRRRRPLGRGGTAGGAGPPRRSRPCRPQRPQPDVRPARAGLGDRPGPGPPAHPRHPLARAQPPTAAPFAAQAPRRAQHGTGACRLRAPAPRLRPGMGAGLLMDHPADRWHLQLHGVGNANAVELGSAMATIERNGRPWLTIDCRGQGLTACLEHYGAAPEALFVTHTHLDHVAGFERLFVKSWFDPSRRGRVRLYVPAPVVALLHRRVADYPNVLAEGGVNFWDAFQLVPV